MTTFRAVIVEDEPLARSRLRAFLDEVPTADVVGVAADGISGLDLIRSVGPDVAFVDIEMPGMDGLTLVRSLERPPLIVYTTAHAEHAVAAFGLAAVDYLLKPFGRRRLADTMDRLTRALASRDLVHHVAHLHVRHNGAILQVAVNDVVRFQGQGDYVAVHLAKRTLLADLRLDKLERQLSGDQFLRVHRSHIINLRAIKEIRRDGSGRLVVAMSDGSVVRTSRGRATQLRQRIR